MLNDNDSVVEYSPQISVRRHLVGQLRHITAAVEFVVVSCDCRKCFFVIFVFILSILLLIVLPSGVMLTRCVMC